MASFKVKRFLFSCEFSFPLQMKKDLVEALLPVEFMEFGRSSTIGRKIEKYLITSREKRNGIVFGDLWQRLNDRGRWKSI